MSERVKYRIRLASLGEAAAVTDETEFLLRAVRSSDTEALGDLMLDSYRGTIDYDGETLDEAVGEIRAYFAGDRGGAPLLESSRVATSGEVMVGACLVSQWGATGLPLITYVMTRAEWKGRGVGRLVLESSLCALRDLGASEVLAVITDGNTASEHLFRSTGFEAVTDV